MKHTLKITLILVAIFLLSQVIGLGIYNKDIKLKTEVNGTITVYHTDTAIGARPEMQGMQSFTYILLALLIGTILVLILIRFKKRNLWKCWYFLAVWLTLTVAFGVFINNSLALFICLALAYFKVFKPNTITHNITELFVYAGMAVVFVPLLNIKWTILLLLVISVYDAYAVWQSKHMIKLAKFTTDTKVFAGLAIPYRRKEKIRASAKKISQKIKVGEESTAILGGGDIAFPLLFSGVVMEDLIKTAQFTKASAYLETLIITFFVSIALFALLTKGKKDTFYPAMPFLTIGCLVGYGIILIINSLLIV